MGMLGELFPGRKLRDEGGEDGDGQSIGDPWDIDLDGGVVRLRPMKPQAPKPAAAPKPAQESAPDAAPE
jgi:hypothetical protein